MKKAYSKIKIQHESITLLPLIKSHFLVSNELLECLTLKKEHFPTLICKVSLIGKLKEMPPLFYECQFY